MSIKKVNFLDKKLTTCKVDIFLCGTSLLIYSFLDEMHFPSCDSRDFSRLPS